MVDVEKTRAELLALFADGQPDGSISPQDIRDLIVSMDINSLSTGLLDGGIVTINGGNNTKVDISSGIGVIIDNHTNSLEPIHKRISWPDFIAEDVPDLIPNLVTFFGLDLSSGAAVVVRRAQPLNAEERRDFIVLAPAIHTGTTQIDSIGAGYSFALDERQTLADLALAIGGINIDKGNVYGPDGADLTIGKSKGKTFFVGVNYQNSKKSPNNTIDLEQSPVTSLFYIYQDGSGGFTNSGIVSSIDPEQWDDGSGFLTSVQANKFTIQRIWHFPLLNLTGIHYGQNEYGTLDEALAAINTEAFNKDPDFITGFRTWMIVKKGITDLEDAVTSGDAFFKAAGKFGDILRD